MATAAGRDPDTLTMSVRVEVEAHGGASSQRAQNRSRLPGDDVEQMIAGISAYQNAGVDHVVLALNTGDVPKTDSADGGHCPQGHATVPLM